MQNENSTNAGQGQNVLNNCGCSTNGTAVGGSIVILPQPKQAAQADSDTGSRQMGRRKTKMLTMMSKVNACAIKCYEEQMPYGYQAVCDAIRNSDKSYAQVIGIQHYKDYLTDGIWYPSNEKPHIHVLVRFVDRKRRVRVKNILGMLNIVFREKLDDELWQNRAVESIGDFPAYTTYLTHETEDAERDGKEIYSMDELVSNLTVEEIQRIREGYIRVSEQVHKVTAKDMVKLDRDAYELGKSLKNFDSWYDSQPFTVRSHAKMKTVRESYERGINSRIEAGDQIIRLCIFIEGQPNTGKTYAAEMAMKELGKQVLTVGGGGSGKFDHLRPDHDVILIDDDVCPNLLNMSDNYIRRAYRRNKNNPVWAGQYFIVTCNHPFKFWIKTCGILPEKQDGTNSEHYDAMVSRFYICRLVQNDSTGKHRLALTSPSTRGNSQEQMERREMFIQFRDRFDAIIATYTPKENFVDFTDMVEPVTLDADEYARYVNAIRPQFAQAAQNILTATGMTPCGVSCSKEQCLRSCYTAFCPYATQDALDRDWKDCHYRNGTVNAGIVAAARSFIAESVSCVCPNPVV